MSDRIRPALRRVLAAVGCLGAWRRLRRWAWLHSDSDRRQVNREWRARFPAFKSAYVTTMSAGPAGPRGAKRALVLSAPSPTIEVEIARIKALQIAGYEPVVVLHDARPALVPYYALAGVREFRYRHEFAIPGNRSGAAASLLAPCGSLDDLLRVSRDGVRVGRIAASTTIRRRRVGSLDVGHPATRADLLTQLASTLAAADRAARMLDAIAPDAALFLNTEYTPNAELFDVCVGRGVPVVAYETAHKGNALLFKRYNTANQDAQIASLSDETWRRAQESPWSDVQARRLDHEMSAGYRTGGWYDACWTQRHTRHVHADAIREGWRLDPKRPTAVIFAHIVWDAPLHWATTLFETYEDWLVETVRAACANDRLNWIVKIHPAHLGKRGKEGFAGEPTEVDILRRRVGPLPPHVTIMPANADVSTWSLFAIMDFCLTVRGTVGIEAARLGIPVITAAQARYSGKGFTVDSPTREIYLQRLAQLPDLTGPEGEWQGQANRYAYALFLQRPLAFSSVSWVEPPSNGSGASLRARGRFHLDRSHRWESAPDIRALATWFADSRAEDFVNEGA